VDKAGASSWWTFSSFSLMSRTAVPAFHSVYT
jgi:hypothetical protein